MPNNVRKIIFTALVLLVIAAVIGFVRTTPHEAVIARKAAAGPSPIVDQAPLQTARTCARLATTNEEDQFASEALRLADRSVDLAFSMALRDAELNPPPQSAQVKELDARIDDLQAHIRNAQDTVKQLTAQIANPGKANVDALQEQLETAQAQLSISQDELEDAQQGLLAAGGDRQTRIAQMHDEYQASQKDTTVSSQQAKTATFTAPTSLLAQAQSYRALRERRVQLETAEQNAASRADDLARKHQALEQETRKQQPAATSADASHAQTIASLHRISLAKRMLADYSKRMQDEQKLAQTYANWSSLLGEYQHSVLHGMLASGIWILLIVIAMVTAEGLVSRFYRDLNADRRKVGTMRMALSFTTQVGGVMAVLLVIFGPPSQLSTFLALTGAGLTVALKDFIVAFFGWFVLMGRNGIRVGDWVEINGIGGEVVEVGVLRTVLLETGNWNDAGHPTGRKVAFVNSFAIEGHYFNFSTTGQWLWDELEILVPAGKDPYQVSDGVRKIVGDATAPDVSLAEQEWQRASHNGGMKNFSAAPAVDVRATAAGVSVVVRYITRANVRYDLRSKLNQSVVELLHGHATGAAS